MSSEMLLANKYLSIINERGKRSLPLKRVYRNMRQQGLFLKAYENLYSNHGATTTGSDPNDTIQGMSLARIDAIIQQLEEGTYLWKPTRRVYVPKADGQKRPISIPGWSDKLVQEVIRLILEAYYEPRFRNSSHGFRPNRGCFTALQQVKRKWTGTKWFIEGDIKGYFDNIPHDLVLSLLSRDIQDNRFLKLVKELLKTGYMENWQYHQTYSGVPQGGVVSPILSNIVLHELDTWVETYLIPQHTRGKRRADSLEHKRLRMRRARATQNENWKQYSRLGKELHRIPSVDPNDNHYRRLRYVRYADDFLLGYIGSKAEADAIKGQISNFMTELGLTLSERKTLVTQASSQSSHFLGYEIKVSWDNDKQTLFSNDMKARSINGKIQLAVPHKVSTKWMQKYCVKGKPQYIAWLQDYSDYEIVSTYGSQLRGLVNYYQLAYNISQELERVHWACTQSCRKTLAKKHKLTQVQSYKRYLTRKTGSRAHIRVMIEWPNKSSLIAQCGEQSLAYQPKTSHINDVIPPFILLGRQRELTKRLLAEVCECCGQSQIPLEAHHINKLSHLERRWRGKKHKPDWVKWMLARRRKVIFVCRPCHEDITYGRYDGQKLV